MITPQAPLGVQSDVTLPKLDPSVRFCFLHHRSNWEVILDSSGTPHLVPVVVPFRFQPGVSGVLQIGDGRAPHGDPGVALTQKEADDWIRIPEEPVVAWGQTLPSYCVRYQGQKGSAHLEAWWKLSDLGGGRIEKEWDQDGWIAWKQSLVQRGIVRNISEPIRKALENDYVRAAQRRRVNPNHAVAVAHSEQYEQRALGCRSTPQPLKPIAAVEAPAPAPEHAPAASAPAAAPDMAPVMDALATIMAQMKDLGGRLAAVEARPSEAPAVVPEPKGGRASRPKAAAPTPAYPPAPPPAAPAPAGPESPLIED